MPRHTIQTSGHQTSFVARDEDAQRVFRFRDALCGRYGSDEGEALMYDALSAVSNGFAEPPRGKVLLDYLDARWWHILPPDEAELAVALEEAAAEGLVDVTEALDRLEAALPRTPRDPWWEQ
jgi:hypothetical protein